MQNTSRSRLWPSIFPGRSPETKIPPELYSLHNWESHISFPRISKENRIGVFLTKLELLLRYFTNFWSTAPRPARTGVLMAGVFIARTPTFFFLLSPSIESFVRRQLCKSPFYGYHEYPLAPSLLMSCCRICTTCTLLEQKYSSRSLVQCAMLNRWTSTLRLTVESATTRPGFRSAAKLFSRERSESCLICALRKIHACESLRFACSSGDLRWAIDEHKQRWRRRRSREGENSWWGSFARLCVRGRRKICRAKLENILDVQRRSGTTFPIRAVHSTCMYSNATSSASAQLACNMTVQHVQVCWEMRWPRPSHDSWPRYDFLKASHRNEDHFDHFLLWQVDLCTETCCLTVSGYGGQVIVFDFSMQSMNVPLKVSFWHATKCIEVLRLFTLSVSVLWKFKTWMY